MLAGFSGPDARQWGSLERPTSNLMKARRIISALVALWLTATFAHAWSQDTFAITGVVRDGAGKTVAGASVRLQPQGEGHGQELKTDGTGNFGFAGLKSGVYVVSARMGDAHSNEATVRETNGAVQRVELTLANGAGGGDKNAKAPEMEFSDVPNFTVAAVTDWTAAGGHGSDTTLRTSESLTRETLRLKAEPKGAGGDASATERRLREAVASAPRDFKANEDLGLFYLSAERSAEAVAPLQTAFETDPTQKDAEYELALALVRSGDAAKARPHADRLLVEGDRPEWHRLAGEVDEKLGDPLGAVHEFERAVKEEPSEENYFAWGTELLEHRAIWQAKDVFETGAKAYPKSTRLLTALGTALFSGHGVVQRSNV
jgi:Tfp pilus assembly protein PilF